MTRRTITNDSFVMERRYAAAPSRVFHAFADRDTKAEWFGCEEGWEVTEYAMDFRVGGKEVWQLGPPGGTVHRNDTTYHEIVPNERLVWSYAMRLDDRCISVSLASVELQPDGAGTLLTLTEHGMYLDGYDDGGDRERGTREGLAKLDAYLQRSKA